LFRVNALEKLIELDATYQDGNSPDRLFDDESTKSEEIRLQAYQKGFEERKKIRRKRKKKKTLDGVMNASWGNADFISVDGSKDGDFISVDDSNDGIFTDYYSDDGVSNDGKSVDERDYVPRNTPSTLRSAAPPEEAPGRAPPTSEKVEL